VSALKTRTSISCRAHEALFVSGESDAPGCARRCLVSGSTKAVFLYCEGFFSLLLSLSYSAHPRLAALSFAPHHRRSSALAVRRFLPVRRLRGGTLAHFSNTWATSGRDPTRSGSD
jgi:hypothetical protein